MSNLVREFGPFLHANDLIAYVSKDETPWETSHMYDRVSESTKVDPALRTSTFKLLKSDEALDAAEKLVQAVSAVDEEYNYVLRRDDVTIIHYEEGGFFKPHADYVTFTSNVIEEFTLLLCLPTTKCTGGETRFHFNARFKVSSESSITPEHLVVFRKDIVHEGKMVTSGVKDIVTLNLYGIKKNVGNHVIIQCSDGGLFSLPQSNIPKDSLFGTLIADLAKENVAIFEIPVTETAAEFEPIHRVMMQCLLPMDEVNYDVMRKYNIDPALMLTPAKNVEQPKRASASTTHVSEHDGLLLFSTPELARYYYDNNPDPNKVLFTAVITEGGYYASFGSSGDSDGPVELDVLMMSVTHKNNCFIEKRLPQEKVYFRRMDFEWFRPLFKLSAEDQLVELQELILDESSPHCLLAWEDAPIQEIIRKRLPKGNDTMEHSEVLMMKPLNKTDMPYGKYLTINAATGETYAYGYQADKLYERLRHLQVHERIKDAVKSCSLRVTCPQTTDTFSEMTCNDHHFGFVNLIVIGGIVDL